MDDRYWLNRPPQSHDYYLEQIGIERNDEGTFNPVYLIPLTKDALQKLKNSGWARSIHINQSYDRGDLFPYIDSLGWTRDNYGPIWIPNKGATIQLTKENLAFYSRCIQAYENNSIEIKDGQIMINGNPVSSYTFKYDYYFMMGDNRHNSQDSRSWGFVPEDHIVGKPILIWMSTDKDRSLFSGGIRWKRIFRLPSKS
jgi:signal peptidase I